MITNWRIKTAYEIGRTPCHIYLRPHALLRPYIAHYTIMTSPSIDHQSGYGQSLTLVPDASGCIVVSMNDKYITASLWGATTKVVTVQSGPQREPVLIFIEFLPGGLFQFTGMGQTTLTDGIFSLSDMTPVFFAKLSHLLETITCVDQLVKGFDSLLIPIMLSRETPVSALSASATLRRTSGLITVNALAAHQGYSPRQLNRVLNDYLGMGPKQFARLLRVNAAVHLMDSGLPLTYLAQESGFYDQAHFIRDFSQICGVTPNDYRDKMSDFYNEPLKF